MLHLATSSLTFDGFENNDYKCLFAHAAHLAVMPLVNGDEHS